MKLLMAVMVLITGLAGAQAFINPDTHAMLVYVDHMPAAQAMDTLEAVGDSDSIDVTGNLYHTVVLTVAGEAIDDATIRVQWSVDGTGWYTEYTEVDAANGVYETHWTALCKYVRFGVTAEHGTSSTVAGAYYGGR